MSENVDELANIIEPTSDPVVIRLPCYEPAGAVIELTDEMLCRNTLLTGTVGSGKTTTLNGILKQLIAYGNAEERPGLFIIDSKRDETVDKIKQYAKEAGRLADVQVLEPNGEYYYPFIDSLTDFSSIPRITALLFSSIKVRNEDTYWIEATRRLFDSALTFLLIWKLNGGAADYFEFFSFCNNWLCGHQKDLPMLKYFKDFDDSLRGTHIDRVIRLKLDEARANIDFWNSLDERNKGILSSFAANFLAPYTSLQAACYLTKRHASSKPLNLDAVFEGKIIVYSVNSVAEPQLAAALGKMIKSDMYYRLQNRRAAYDEKIRMVGLVFDEYPLVATGEEPRYGDVEQLQTLRSKRGFVIAATQGHSSLYLKLGHEVAAALLINFNNLFFFKSNEPQVEYFASLHFGTRDSKSVVHHFSPETWDTSLKQLGNNPDSITINPITLPVCPMGSLPALETGQAYVSLANGQKWDKPVWIQPTYYSGVINEVSNPSDGTEQLVAIIKARQDALRPKEIPKELNPELIALARQVEEIRNSIAEDEKRREEKIKAAAFHTVVVPKVTSSAAL